MSDPITGSPEMKAMRVSIGDVARRAGVSISTVSRVINRRELVNAETRQRVDQAIAELGYRPNMFARGLMLRKSDMLGLALPDVHGEFYSEVIRGANAKARELGYHLVISSTNGPEDAQTLLEDLLRRSIVDGMAIMVSEQPGGRPWEQIETRLPLVLLDGAVEDGEHDSVVIDQRAGAQALMRHLIRRCGMKRILFMGGLTTNVDTMARRQVYEEVMRAADLPVSPEDVYHLDFQYETAYAFARDRVKGWAGSRHCVFAANDEMACAVIDAATEARVRVPQDLAVVGFDDTRIARMTRPPLTTVRVPMSTMGATAIELLHKRLADPDQPPTHVSLTPQLMVRESCGAAQQAGAKPAPGDTHVA